MLSHDHGIVTLIYVCNCETYVNNNQTYRRRSNYFSLLSFFGCNFISCLPNFKIPGKLNPIFIGILLRSFPK